MKSYKITESEKPLVEINHETPIPVGKQVLVKTIACGVCHSDIHIHDGFFDGGDGNKIPSRLQDNLTMGHEVYGELVSVGEEVSNVEIGKKYVIYPWIGCGECDQCNNGMEHYCSPFTAQNLGVNVDGGYSDYVLVKDEKYLFDAGDAPDNLAGSYACRGLTAYSALKKTNQNNTSNKLAIIGAGGLGVLALKIAKSAFNIQPLVIDIDEQKLNLAKELGASAVFNATHTNVVEEVSEFSNGGVHAVIDFVGSEQTLELGNKLFGLNKGCKYILVGLFGGKYSLTLPMMTFGARTIEGSYVGSLAEMHELMELVRTNKIEPVKVNERNLSEVNKTLADLKNGNIEGLVCLKP